MTRPTIFDRPMTAAERMRRHRARGELPVPRNVKEAVARMTRVQQAAYVGSSLRHWYYVREFNRYREIKWSGDVLNGKHGKVGMAFLAWVCNYGDRDVQHVIGEYFGRLYLQARNRPLYVIDRIVGARASGTLSEVESRPDHAKTDS